MVESATQTGRRSRVHGPRRILKELQRLLIKTARAYEHRDLDANERRWLMQVHANLKMNADTGDQVLPGLPDPRDSRRAVKRPRRPLAQTLGSAFRRSTVEDGGSHG